MDASNYLADDLDAPYEGPPWALPPALTAPGTRDNVDLFGADLRQARRDRAEITPIWRRDRAEIAPNFVRRRPQMEYVDSAGECADACAALANCTHW